MSSLSGRRRRVWGPQHGRPPASAGPQVSHDQDYSLDHDQGTDHGGEQAGGRLGAAHNVVEAVPDGHQQDAATVQAVTATAAIAGPSSAGRWVGQPTPRRTTRWAAASGMSHDQLSA